MPRPTATQILNVLRSLGLISGTRARYAKSAAADQNWLSLLISEFGKGLNLKSRIRRSDLPPGVWEILHVVEEMLKNAEREERKIEQAEVVLTTRFPRRPPTAAEEASEWSDIFHTPTSSNVYSFQYHRRPGDTHGTLFVTYKASTFHEGSLQSRAGFKTSDKKYALKRRLVGKSGRTIKGKQNAPGARYAYLRVPPSVFERMKDAYSKGKFIWDNIRIRGTIYGHRYTYVLAQGQIVEGHGRLYVPRKATSKGFQTRSVRTGSTGRGGFVTSTLRATTGEFLRGPVAPTGRAARDRFIAGILGGATTSTLPPASGGGGFTTRPAPGRR